MTIIEPLERLSPKSPVDIFFNYPYIFVCAHKDVTTDMWRSEDDLQFHPAILSPGELN